jgi:hypothetical protein
MREDNEVEPPDSNGNCNEKEGWQKKREDGLCYRSSDKDLESERDAQSGGDYQDYEGENFYEEDPYADLFNRITRRGQVTVEEIPQSSGKASGGSVSSYNRDIGSSSMKFSPFDALSMYDIPSPPRGLGYEDYRMARKDPNYLNAYGLAALVNNAKSAAKNSSDGYNFGFARGGMAPMPEYQAGGKLLRGPGDGMSDDIPAVIRGKGVQRAALADGEFVIPADVVSHLGNGSTEAGAKKLYQMMALIRKARTGKSKQAPQVSVDKFLPVPSRKKSRR